MARLVAAVGGGLGVVLAAGAAVAAHAEQTSAGGLATLAMSATSLVSSGVSLVVGVRLAYHRGQMDQRVTDATERLRRLEERAVMDEHFAAHAARQTAAEQKIHALELELARAEGRAGGGR